MLRLGTPRVLMIALIALASLAVPAGATALLFTDRVAWEAATSGLFTINFEGLATPSVPGNYSNSSGLTLGGVQFTGLTPPASYYLYTQDPGALTDCNWNSGDLLIWHSIARGGGYIQANPPAGGATSVGSDIMTRTPFAVGMTVILSSGETFQVSTQSRPIRSFAGFTLGVPITFIWFVPSSGFPMIENFSDGSAPAPAEEAPDRETFVFGGTGLLSLWLARRMRRHSRQP
jgi:hypothetical protein